MGNTKEQDTKVQAQVADNSSAIAQDSSNTTADGAIETTSEDKERRLKGQITALQKKLEDIESARQQDAKIFEALKSVVSEDKSVDNPEDVVRTLQQEFTEMQNQLKLSKVESQKNAYIDDLEVNEVVKRELKRRVSVNPNMNVETLSSAVNEELSALSELLDVQRKSTISPDIRPKNQGSVSIDAPASNDFNAWEEYMKKTGSLK
jgi:hypothetical protein